MSQSLKQSIKEKLKVVAKERNLTFEEVWHNLVLERFLARLSQSVYKTNFILKGGTLLARYIPLERETKDLDFLVERLKNNEAFLSRAFDEICCINLKDGFEFEKVKIGKLSHPHMDYTGIEVLLLVKLGSPQSYIQIDLGFGDIVEPITYPMTLTTTSKGPLFENQIQVRSYPKEFIFAEKLETIVHRGAGNSRMKDFHDLFSLTSLEDFLNTSYTDTVVREVFRHRQTPIEALPIHFDIDAMGVLQSAWENYRENTFSSKEEKIPNAIKDIIESINTWMNTHTTLCKPLSGLKP